MAGFRHRVSPNSKTYLVGSFPPVLHPTIPPHILILGTIPSSPSPAQAKFYGHPSNALWWLAGQLFILAQAYLCSCRGSSWLQARRPSRPGLARGSVLQQASQGHPARTDKRTGDPCLHLHRTVGSTDWSRLCFVGRGEGLQDQEQ